MHITVNELQLSTCYYENLYCTISMVARKINDKTHKNEIYELSRNNKTANIYVKTAQFIKKLCNGGIVVEDMKLQKITVYRYKIPNLPVKK